MTQVTIFNTEEMTESPTRVLASFVAAYENPLDAIAGKENDARDTFIEWFIRKYGTGESQIRWIATTRWLRTLQEIRKEYDIN